MSYYTALNLEREPFSTSPDPDFFYHSQSHYSALKRVEIAIRLRRGLSIVLGDVGAGKTTLSRTLLQQFKDEEDFIFCMILDPGYKSEYQFLFSLTRMLDIMPQFRSTLDFKEALEKFLFQKGVEENKTIVLLIDEGQKISRENLEVLRMLLNYETNEYKLLQLVIMAQTELLARIRHVHNFVDRVALQYSINPLDEQETASMIRFRLRTAGYSGSRDLFSDCAVRLIYEYSRGYPRRIAMLCHDALEALIMNDKSLVDVALITELITAQNRL